MANKMGISHSACARQHHTCKPVQLILLQPSPSHIERFTGQTGLASAWSNQAAKNKSRCMRTSMRWMGTAHSAPMMGPKIQIQRSADMCAIAAGPRVRAGFREPEEIGERTMRSAPNVAPTTRGPLSPTVERGLHAISSTTNVAMSVPRNSAAQRWLRRIFHTILLLPHMHQMASGNEIVEGADCCSCALSSCKERWPGRCNDIRSTSQWLCTHCVAQMIIYPGTMHLASQ